MKLSADSGDAESLYECGTMLLDGDIVKVDNFLGQYVWDMGKRWKLQNS